MILIILSLFFIQIDIVWYATTIIVDVLGMNWAVMGLCSFRDISFRKGCGMIGLIYWIRLITKHFFRLRDDREEFLLVGRGIVGILLLWGFIETHSNKKVMGEVERISVFEVVADHTLIGWLHTAIGDSTLQLLIAWGWWHFHKNRIYIRKSAITSLSYH